MLTFRFANVDGIAFVEATRDLDPAQALFIVSSAGVRWRHPNLAQKAGKIREVTRAHGLVVGAEKGSPDELSPALFRTAV